MLVRTFEITEDTFGIIRTVVTRQNFGTGSKFRDNLNIVVTEEGGGLVSYITMNEANQDNLVADFSSVLDNGMMRECRDALISMVRKTEATKEEERTK